MRRCFSIVGSVVCCLLALALPGEFSTRAFAEPAAPGPRQPPEAAATTGHSDLDAKIDALQRAIDRQDWSNAATIAKDATKLAAKYNLPRLVLPLSRVVPNLYAIAGDLPSAEAGYHSLIRGVLTGDIPAPSDELARDISMLTTAFVERGGSAEAIASVERLIASFGDNPDKDKAGSVLLHLQGQSLQRLLLYDASVDAMQKSLDLARKTFAPNSTEMAITWNDVGYFYLAATHVQEAEEPLKTALRILEQNDPANLREIGTTCQNLSTLYLTLRDLPTAQRFAARAVESRAKALTKSSPKYLESYYTLGEILAQEKKLREAISIVDEVRQEFEKQGDLVGQADMTRRIANFYLDLGERDRAKQEANSAIAMLKAAPDNVNKPILLATLLEFQIDRELEDNNLAGAHADAEQLIAGVRGRFAADHNMQLFALEAAARVALAENDSRLAVTYSDQIAAGLKSQFDRVSSGSSSERPLSAGDGIFDVVFRVAARFGDRSDAELDRTFQMAQWLELGGAGFAVRQMAARAASTDPKLSGQVKELQDLGDRAQGTDVQLSQLESAPQRDEAEIAKHIEMLRVMHDELDRRREQIRQSYPDYAALIHPKPLSVGETQTLLAEDEVLVKFFLPARFDEDERALVWAVGKHSARWAEITPSAKHLSEVIQALRCGLDQSAWTGEAGETCAKLFGIPQDDATAGLPFDVDRAFELHQALFAPISDITQGKRLIVVSSGALAQFPLSVLVAAPVPAGLKGPARTAEDAARTWRATNWLMRSQPLTTLPAVASLRALRASAKPSHATRQFVGFGDPLLDGRQNDKNHGDDYKRVALEARNRQICSARPPLTANLAMALPERGPTRIFRGRQADPDELRAWTPLPETADEVCEIGRLLGAEAADIFLGERATVSNLKRLSDTGELSKYAIVYFATHGALSGDVKGTAEPGLILTPPNKEVSDPAALERDNGFLSASQITTLSLDANLVVMAACNTAGDSAETNESLGGIARAFFFAGARSVLVSHWEVDSQATVPLMTGMAKRDTGGRAEALQASQIEMVDHGDVRYAHPSYWSPFVLVGEGSAPK